MGLSASLSGAESSGGSRNYSQNYGMSESYSETDAAAARAWSAQQAEIARDWQEKMFEKEMQYNAQQAELARKFSKEEAQRNRDYQQAQVDVANEMANTVYTRSSANMKEAGINPILAFTAGLGGAGSGSVSGGATAATTGTSASAPSGFMGQSFMDQHSASNSMQQGEASGSSWEQSQSGLATALQQMGSLIKEGLATFNSANNINVTLDNLAGNVKDMGGDIWNEIVSKMPSQMRDLLGIKSINNSANVSRKKNITGSTSIQGHSDKRNYSGGLKK